tara:strand:+ start:89 stop:280 length:192 start_codon:yes stop_codon:yes gene_type:complete
LNIRKTKKGYLLFFSKAKQLKTSIEKYNSPIFDGKGFNNCISGLSKKCIIAMNLINSSYQKKQ